jgi:hypothetical protein
MEQADRGTGTGRSQGNDQQELIDEVNRLRSHREEEDPESSDDFEEEQ